VKKIKEFVFGHSVVNIYKALLALAEDEDIGDFTDVMNGWDMVVEKHQQQDQVNSQQLQFVLNLNKLHYQMIMRKLILWLKEQPNALEVQTQYDYEFIKKKLQEYLTQEKK
jgi:hypothetical protein